MTIKSSKILFTLTLVFVGTFAIRAALAPHTVTANIRWAHYIEAGLPEQDVFVASDSAHVDAPDPYFISSFFASHSIPGPNVIRVEGKAALTPSILAKPVYATIRIVPHDPFKLGPNPLGPYYQGDSLGFTLGQWLAARGGGTYTVTGEVAELNLAFQQLVPNGHYALWCGHMSPAPNYEEVDKACAAADGSQNRFTADPQGSASFHLNLKALPESTPAFTTLLLLTYERDINPVDDEWGGYGLKSHVQLFYAFPASSNATDACRAQSVC